MEPVLTLFQVDQPLAVFLFEKLKEHFTNLLERLVRAEVLERAVSIRKLFNIDLQNESNLFPVEIDNVGAGPSIILNKSASTQAVEVRNFRRNAFVFW